MAALRLHRTPEGIGATFPAEILSQMRVGEGDTLDLRHTPDGILLTPLGSPRAEVIAVAERLMTENIGVLRALAK